MCVLEILIKLHCYYQIRSKIKYLGYLKDVDMIIYTIENYLMKEVVFKMLKLECLRKCLIIYINIYKP